MKCPDCGHINIPGDDECGQCERSLTDLDAPSPQDSVEVRIMNTRIRELEPAVPYQVSPDTSLGEVAHAMADKGIGCVLVTQDDQLQGIFSERDLLLRVGARFKEQSSVPIRQFMTPKPILLRGKDTVAFALNHMDAGDYRHIPIVTKDKVTGIISVRDIMSYLVDHVNDK